MKIPTIQEIQAYIDEINVNVDAEDFFDYNETRGWTVGKYGKAPMKRWKSAVRGCARRGYAKTAASTRRHTKRNARPRDAQRARGIYQDFFESLTPRALQDKIDEASDLKHPTQETYVVWLMKEVLEKNNG